MKKKNDNFLINISLNVIIPSVIMTKYSSAQHLGQKWGLIIALLFPLSYGVFDLLKERKFNFFSALGLFSVLMTGGIGLLKLDRNWMIVKETAIPAIMGIVVLVSEFAHFSLVRKFLEQILDFDKIESEFGKVDRVDHFNSKLKFSSVLLGLTFFVSAILNYVLAIYTLVGEPGTEEFNKSLGIMTAYSFPVISVPMMVMTGIIIFRLLNMIKKETGLEFDAVLISPNSTTPSEPTSKSS